MTLRADSAFFSHSVIKACVDNGVCVLDHCSPGQSNVAIAISAVDEQAWTPIPYTDNGEAEVAETTHWGHRLVIRRTKLIGEQAALFPDWRYHAFITNRRGTAVLLDQFHRYHAQVELVNGAWVAKTGKWHRRNHCCQDMAQPPVRHSWTTDHPRPQNDAAPARELTMGRTPS